MLVQVRSWKRLINSEHLQQNQESEEWLESHTQPCPTCTAKVQRTGGCNHMICTVCGQHFCYVCGRDWCAHCRESRSRCAFACLVVSMGPNTQERITCTALCAYCSSVWCAQLIHHPSFPNCLGQVPENPQSQSPRRWEFGAQSRRAGVSKVQRSPDSPSLDMSGYLCEFG